MRVLLVGRPEDNVIGGDFLQIERTRIALQNRGIECDSIKCLDLTGVDIHKYDIIHIFVMLVRGIQSKIIKGKKIVLSPLYRDPNYAE